MFVRDHRLLRRIACLIGALGGMAGVRASVAAPVPTPVPLEISHAERLLVVAPHPDDETLGAGGLIQRVLEVGGTVRVVLITAGGGYIEAVEAQTGLPHPRPSQYIAYGERRVQEARAAVRELGGDRVRLQLLGFPDGGLLPLLHAHWRRTHPERSSTTGARKPPYPEALDPRVAYDGYDLRRELERILRESHPTMVVLPHPLDRHPDHHATGLFLLLALADVVGESATPMPLLPRLLAYLVHWPDWPPGWNATPSLAATETTLELPPAFAVGDGTRADLTLSKLEVTEKGAALAKYETQQEVTASLLAAFVRRTEPFVLLSPAALRDATKMIEQSAIAGRKVRRPHARGSPRP
jgi:LmbE family N-acetylglucosaminyl deacetylase